MFNVFNCSSVVEKNLYKCLFVLLIVRFLIQFSTPVSHHRARTMEYVFHSGRTLFVFVPKDTREGHAQKVLLDMSQIFYIKNMAAL